MKDLNYWNPEDPKFWETKGKRVASRNLWISIPNLLIAFCVWQIWSILSLKLIGIIPIILFALFALLGMNNLPLEKPKLSNQLKVFKRKHMYLITVLYIMSFGSFIGYSAAFPLLLKGEFSEINVLQLVFIGPLLGALGRPVGGYLADKFGGAKF
ncbi:hypothetical protein [Neobacillus drentensis]|uniref:hypothetical protein n=1 Tax=Neobacillus drentensis TaxID=220684 RepID=UPI0030002A80